MKRSSLILLVLSVMLLGACHRSTCPTYNQNTGEAEYSKKSKTKSSLYPKNMK